IQDAVGQLKANLGKLTNLQARSVAAELDRASQAAQSKDPQLAQDLLDAANAVRAKDTAKATAALDAAQKRFAGQQSQQAAARAVEQALASLEDGRQEIAKTGAPPASTKHPQVGFRRSSAPSAAAPNQGTQSQQPNAPQPDAGSTQDPTGNGMRIGQNQPAFGSSGGASTGPQGSQSAGSGASGGGSGGQGAQAGPPSAQAGPAQAGASGGGAGTGSNGTNLGRITGPIRGGGGTQNPTGEAAGNGITASSGQPAQAGDQPAERIYVPGSGTIGGGAAGQAAPEAGTHAGAGRAGEGSTQDAPPPSPCP